MMDVRSPGSGQLAPDGSRLFFGGRHRRRPGLAARRSEHLPGPADGGRGPHDDRRHHPRREDAHPLPRPQGRGEPGPLPDAGRRRPDEGRPAPAEDPDGLRVRQRGREVALLPRQRRQAELLRRLPVRAGDREEGDRLRRAGPLVRRRPPPRRPRSSWRRRPARRRSSTGSGSRQEGQDPAPRAPKSRRTTAPSTARRTGSSSS